jgi:Ca2+-binding EF-hand superfamily protein
MVRTFLTLAFCLAVVNANAADKTEKTIAKPKITVIIQTAKGPAVQQLQLRRYGGITAGTGGVREKVDLKDSTERVLFLAPGGPILVELDIKLDGKPFRTLREKIIDELMQQTDTDNNGNHTWKEAFSNPRFAFGRLRTSYQTKNTAYLKSLLARYDSDKNGQVSRYELRLMLSQIGYGTAFRVTPNYSRTPQPNIKKLLDQNNDRKISQAELKTAAARLKSRDANDNDLLEMSELTGGATQGNRYAFQQRGVRLPTTGRGVYLLGPAADLVAVYSAILTKYGNKQKKIPAAAFRLYPKMFKTLDLNKNGFLDSGESIGFHLIKPQARIQVFLGSKKKGTAALKIQFAKKPLQIAMSSGNSTNQLALNLPDWKVRFDVPAMTLRRVDYTRTAQFYVTRYDKNKNGYIEEKEMGTNVSLVAQFKNWDANSDGKVFLDEIKKTYEKTVLAQQSQITAMTSSQGPSLFAALDTSGDKRLSLREMRSAGARLLSLDKNKDGKIGSAEMPGEAVVTFSRGGAYRYNPRSLRGGVLNNGISSARRGPKWFVHMDKNGDGDITLREFLGTKKKFQELDKNKDGFIEFKEALQVAKKSAKK